MIFLLPCMLIILIFLPMYCMHMHIKLMNTFGNWLIAGPVHMVSLTMKL